MSERIPDQLIETIRNRVDLVAVVSEHLTLKKSGQNYTGLCPFHTEKTPSFVVNPQKQFFHCFGCSAGGDVFQFVSKIEQLSFPEVVRRFALKAGVTLPVSQGYDRPVHDDREPIFEVNEAAAQQFHQNLMEHPSATDARAYLKSRGISTETIQAFSIGFALPRKDDLMKQMKSFPLSLLESACLAKRGENGYYDYFRNRVMVPIKTPQGRVVGFGGRVLDQSAPKYLNTPETAVFTKGKHLFGLHLARGKKALIVVEGYFDAIALHQAGMNNAVATLGTALTADHLQLIHRFAEKVYLVFDPDRAGLAAALRSAPLFIEAGISAEVVSLPAGQDPDLFVRTAGPDGFSERLAQGQPLIDFIIAQTARAAGSSISDRTRSIQELFPLIRKGTGTVEQGYYLKKIADLFGVEETDLRTDFAHHRKEHPEVAQKPQRPVGEKNRFPQDEETILALLIQGECDLTRLSGVVPDDFTTPALRQMAYCFWDAPRETWIGSIKTDFMDVVTEPLYTQLAVVEIAEENRPALQVDCVRSLYKKRLDREAHKIQRALKSAEQEGDLDRLAALQQTFFSLKKELQMVTAPTHSS
jgi:DNA primase